MFLLSFVWARFLYLSLSGKDGCVSSSYLLHIVTWCLAGAASTRWQPAGQKHSSQETVWINACFVLFLSKRGFCCVLIPHYTLIPRMLWVYEWTCDKKMLEKPDVRLLSFPVCIKCDFFYAACKISMQWELVHCTYYMQLIVRKRDIFMNLSNFVLNALQISGLFLFYFLHR